MPLGMTIENLSTVTNAAALEKSTPTKMKLFTENAKIAKVQEKFKLKKISQYLKPKKKKDITTSVQFETDLFIALRNKLNKEHMTFREWAEASARRYLDEK